MRVKEPVLVHLYPLITEKVTPTSARAPYTLPDRNPGRMSSLRLAEGSPKQEEHAFQPVWCSSSPL